MNAQDLDFADRTFDAVMSMSTFEHIADVPKALSEIHRVLKPGGKVLLSFEPLWTCAYGHHLHHFGDISEPRAAMGAPGLGPRADGSYLEDKWPADAAISLEDAILWTMTAMPSTGSASGGCASTSTPARCGSSGSRR